MNKNKTIDKEADTEEQDEGRDTSSKAREWRVTQGERSRVVFMPQQGKAPSWSLYNASDSPMILMRLGCLMVASWSSRRHRYAECSEG
jgi:hypothetical protein